MPTATETALTEAHLWLELAHNWSRESAPEAWEDRPPREKDIVVFYDPADDLVRRAGEWGHRLDDHDLAFLAGFSAALAQTEAEAWDEGVRDLATRAFEARRFLVADRIIHWAVPWLDTVGRCYPGLRETAHIDRDFLLSLGEAMRLAPEIPGREGLVPEGHDSFGPVEINPNRRLWVSSLWSGHLVLEATLNHMVAATPIRTPANDDQLDDPDVALLYDVAAGRWRNLARRHPGTAQLWTDLATRADTTRDLLSDLGSAGHNHGAFAPVRKSSWPRS